MTLILCSLLFVDPTLGRGAKTMQSMLVQTEKYEDLLSALVPGEPPRGIIALLEAEVEYHKPESPAYVLRVHDDFCNLSGEEKWSVIHHEWHHTKDFSNRRLQLLLKSLPPSVARAYLEVQAYQAEMEGPRWKQTSIAYRKSVQRRVAYYHSQVTSWVKSEEPLGAYTLELAMQSHGSKKLAKKALKNAKEALIEGMKQAS